MEVKDNTRDDDTELRFRVTGDWGRKVTSLWYFV